MAVFEKMNLARLDDQGRMIPSTPEELAARVVALKDAFKRMAEIPDDDVMSDEEYLRLLDRKYQQPSRRVAQASRQGIAQAWLHGFSSTLASSGWRRSTRKIRR